MKHQIIFIFFEQSILIHNMEVNIDCNLKYFEPKKEPQIKLTELETSINQWMDEFMDDYFIGQKSKSMFSTLGLSQIQGYPFTQDIRKLTLLSVFNIWLILVDDRIQENPELYDQLFTLFSDQQKEQNSSIGKMMEKYWNQIKDDLNDFQKKRFINGCYDFFRSTIDENECSDEYKSKMKTISNEEYIKLREKSFFIDFMFINVEYASEIRIDENIYNLEIMEFFRKNISRYIMFVNDLYSFKKEYKQDGALMNYVTVVHKNNRCSNFQQAIDIIVDELKIIEKELFETSNKLKTELNHLIIFKDFIDSVGNALYSTLEFHKNAKRYE